MASVTPTAYNGRYELLTHIARGGMAEVYLARDLLLDRSVALKVLFPELSVDRSFVERFRREAQAAARLSHPNIVSVYDWGQADTTYFIVMELVDGEALSTLLRAQGALPPERAVSIAMAVASALDYAHRHGVVHRDIKPGNVLLAEDGQVKVTDFGIARAANADDSLTQTGAVMGTASYFSPEQAQGESLDGRTDIYSLGVVLYEMVTGQVPFRAETPLAIAYKHVREEPVPPRALNPAVAPDLDAVIVKCLAKDPNRRYQSAESLRQDLQRFASGRGVAAVQEPRSTVLAPVAAFADTGEVPVVTDMGGGSGEERPRRGLLAALGTLLGVVLLAIVGLVLYKTGMIGQSSGIVVPGVTGKTLGEAEAALREAGLSWRVQGVNQVNDARVVAQSPAPPAKVPAGGSVLLDTTLITVPIPAVDGLRVAAATQKLTQEGFVVTTTTQTSDTAKKGIVLGQVPGPGSPGAKGSTVTLTVGGGPQLIAVPNLVGLTVAEAATTLGNNGLALGTTTPQASSSIPVGTIISQTPRPGVEVGPGSLVGVDVSSGPPPTTTTTTTTTTTIPPTTSTSSTTTSTSSTTTSTTPKKK
jgi:serine/threonine-protein kinase